MKKLPLGIQTFEKLITGGYLYIDKTREIHKLFAGGGQYYFLSRPRRFGKSLLVSTLKEIFSGNRQLFKGLWIYDKIDWKPYPLIQLDFSGLRYGSEKEMTDTLDYLINLNAEKHGLELKSRGYDKRFGELIRRLSKKERVVILIDEYDRPIIDYVDQEDIAKKNREILNTFYGAVKSLDAHVKFALITGVSKFSKVSVFSGINNLRDITLSHDFAALLGYTEEELSHYFAPHLERMAGELQVEREELTPVVRKWYNGYSWDGNQFVYNPFSILSLFSENRFDNYWFASGTPTLLLKRLRITGTPLEKLESYDTDGSIFESYDIERLHTIALLFQTGYLTVKRIEKVSIDRRRYILSYPNIEVRESFLKHVLAAYSGKFPDEAANTVYSLTEKITRRDIDGFFQDIQALFASIPSHLFIKDRESYYHTVIYLVLTLMGITADVEVHTNKGRIDAVLQTETGIYIMEFKLGTPEKALTQIEKKQYHQRFLSTGKSITLIGVGISPSEQNISRYKIKELKPPVS